MQLVNLPRDSWVTDNEIKSMSYGNLLSEKIIFRKSMSNSITMFTLTLILCIYLLAKRNSCHTLIGCTDKTVTLFLYEVRISAS